MIQMAEDNPPWGYRRIQGALANLGRQLDKLTVRNILRRHHLEPAPQRRKTGGVDRSLGGVPLGEALPAPRPRDEIHRSVRYAAQGQRGGTGPLTTSEPEAEHAL